MFSSMAEHRNLLALYLRPLRGRILLLALLLAASIALQLLNPQVIRYFIDTAQGSGAPAALVLAALGYLAVGLAQQGTRLLTAWLSLNVGWQATNALRTDLVRHCLGLDMPFHKQHTPGELIERIDGDVTALADFFSQFLVRLAGGLLLIAAILFLLYRENVWAGLALTVYVFVVLAVLLLVQRLGTRRWLAARQGLAQQTSFLEECHISNEDIRGSGAEAYVLGRLDTMLADLIHKVRAGQMADALSASSTSFLFVVGYSLGLALGAWLYLRGDVTIGGAFVLVVYVGMLAGPLEELRGQSTVLQQASAGVERIAELRRLQPHVREVVPATPFLPSGALGVTFERVSFAYDDAIVPLVLPPLDGAEPGSDAAPEPLPAADPVLQDLSFALAPGHTLGVLGRTGSGKTTLTRLLFRLYDPSAGCIRLNGCPLPQIPLADLRRSVGMVTQDVQLFHASLRDNITFFDPTIKDHAIEQALAELGLIEWVQRLPAGLATQLGGSQGLSAGEAQLVAFARVLLRDPGLVILDEAASRLDPVTERRLETAIDRLLRGRTAIVIAHRLHTLQRADEVLLLENGRMAEYGPRAALAADPSTRFAHLLRTGLEEALA